jgi:hypothetical protein
MNRTEKIRSRPLSHPKSTTLIDRRDPATNPPTIFHLK